MRISDWSSDVCSSDLKDIVEEAWSSAAITVAEGGLGLHRKPEQRWAAGDALDGCNAALPFDFLGDEEGFIGMLTFSENKDAFGGFRSEEHTSELQSLMRISYAVFCLKKKIYKIQNR